MNQPLAPLAALLAPEDDIAAASAGSLRLRAAAVLQDRAQAELRRGRPLALGWGPHWLLVAAVETMSEALLARLAQVGAAPQLLLSAERLAALGRPATAAQALALPPGTGLAQLQQWAALAPPTPGATALPPPAEPAPTEYDAASAAALALCKRARLVPALLLVHLEAAAGPVLAQAQVMCLPLAELGNPEGSPQAPRTTPCTPHSTGLRRASTARVPLAEAEDCTLVLFSETDGDAEHLAVIVGQLAGDMPVPVRLHSACLTGDLLGSLRCDCGPQLQRAVAQMRETGGVLLYLAQEGRGIGLANKLRAYDLQDTGLDTLQANRTLGFREEERDFSIAAAMLQALGYTRIQLLTNNPQKIAALRQCGIDVVERLPLPGPVNPHNERYLRTKEQAGHLGATAAAQDSGDA